jgi:hypothetical protein
MKFDNIPAPPYLNLVLDIIRNGINLGAAKIKIRDNEGLKNQALAETFNYFGTTDEKKWIGVSKENVSGGRQSREDIYFYLNDDNHTRIFYLEGKRLPKYQTQTGEEYVIGINNSGNPSGGIERFKAGIHGDPSRIFHNGLIAYVENNSIEYWNGKVNETIQQMYGINEVLIKKIGFSNEYSSTHLFDCESNSEKFCLHHFWVKLF